MPTTLMAGAYSRVEIKTFDRESSSLPLGSGYVNSAAYIQKATETHGLRILHRPPTAVSSRLARRCRIVRRPSAVAPRLIASSCVEGTTCSRRVSNGARFSFRRRKELFSSKTYERSKGYH